VRVKQAFTPELFSPWPPQYEYNYLWRQGRANWQVIDAVQPPVRVQTVPDREKGGRWQRLF